MDLFPVAPADLSAASREELEQFITDSVEAAQRIAENPAEYVSEDRSVDELRLQMEAAVDAIAETRAELTARFEAEVEEGEAEGEEEGEAEGEAEGEEEAALDPAAFAELASRARAESAEPEPEPEPEPEDEGEEESASAAVAPAVTAASRPAPRRPLPRPPRARAAAPQPSNPTVTLTAAIGTLGTELGSDVDLVQVGDMMMRRHKQFGRRHSEGEKHPIARADWTSLYPEERRLDKDEVRNMAVIAAAVNDQAIRREMDKRKKLDTVQALTASGGLCAPPVPYYDLLQVAVNERPVRAALPNFNADRGGIRAATPQTIANVTTGVGVIAAIDDESGGTFATKTCQAVECEPWHDCEVDIIYHCIQFGNLGARTFPEQVAHWNNLVLAAHARTAETNLLDCIAASSTAVTAGNLLGATGDLLSQALSAAAGMRSRHRMDPDAVLRAIFPRWVLDLLVSDVYRSQFQRFDMTPESFVQLLRQGNIEPSFTIDGPTGGAQVFGVQPAGALLSFPATVVWYLYPEGSFLFLDGGSLELGLVRDSVLNETNDFQIFGETFENCCYVGFESLQITSTTCDNGKTSLPTDLDCPISYA